MHLSPRSRMSILFSLVALLAIVGVVVATFLVHNSSTSANASSSATTDATFKTSAGKITQISTGLVKSNLAKKAGTNATKKKPGLAKAAAKAAKAAKNAGVDANDQGQPAE